jgi:hypothetical protein
MARIRTIKPEFWTSEQVMECSPNARLLFIGLWNFCDDHGRHPYAPKQIKALIFPSDNFSAEEVAGMFAELSANGLLVPYNVEGKEYFQITGWHHQKIDKPQKPKYPEPIGERSANGRDGTHSTEGNTEREKDSSEPIGSGAGAPSGVVAFDARKQLFDEGLPLLARATGRPEQSLRSVVGKWLKAVNDDAERLTRVIAETVRDRRADPVSWIERSLKPADPDAAIYRNVL